MAIAMVRILVPIRATLEEESRAVEEAKKVLLMEEPDAHHYQHRRPRRDREPIRKPA